MEPTILTSILGIIVFSTIMYFGFKYANGNCNVSASKKEHYLRWVTKYGKTTKKSILIISIIYGISMLLQLLILI